MIELLLQAERALSVGLLDQAERLYDQAAAADPRNSIAVVGLARVALERGDEAEAWRLAGRALGIDPENVAAQRLARRLEEVWAYRGESLPEPAESPSGLAVVAPEASGTAAEPAPEPASTAARPSEPPARRSVVDRLLRRHRP